MHHLRLFALGLAMVGTSCTTDNPLYTPAGSNDDLGLGSSSDGAVQPGTDLGLVSMPDLAQPNMSCVGDQRGCTSTSAVACVGGMFVVDRVCPSASTCASGHCSAPTPAGNNVGKNCAPTGAPTESLCVSGLSGGNTSAVPSCEPFIDPALPTADKVAWVCASRIGMGLPGQACTDGAFCRSGFCGSNGTCFRACITPADCPTQGPGTWKCNVVDIVVEGSTIKASSCVM